MPDNDKSELGQERPFSGLFDELLQSDDQLERFIVALEENRNGVLDRLLKALKRSW